MRITPSKQKNVWGVQADGLALEPQRSDLWYADFSNAVRGISEAYTQLGVTTAALKSEFPPQFVTSVALPAFTTRPEVFRRSSIPYNLPSWDEPLDVVRVVFLLEQSTELRSLIYDFVTRWQSLVRWGRGTRAAESTADDERWPDPENAITPEFRFDFQVHLMRGSQLTPVFEYPDIAQLNAKAQQAYSSRRRIQDALKLNDFTASFDSSIFTSSTSAQITQTTGWLQVGATFSVQQAWLASFKLSDLAYANPNLVTLETTFYAESIVLDSGKIDTYP